MKQGTEIFLDVLRELQRIDSEFPLQYAICLCEISRNEGLCMTDLSGKTGMALSTVSRITAALSNKKSGKKTYGLIHVKISTKERRKKEIFLTAKGRDTIKVISNIILDQKEA